MPKHSLLTAIHPPFIVSATEPTSGSVGFTLQENHVWVDTSSDPAVYRRATGVVAGVVDEWVLDNPGPAGDDGAGLNYLGAWNSGASYVEFDVVTLDGSSYVATASSLNQTPPNVTYWDVLAAKGDDASVADATHAATGKTTPVDADELPLADSAASFGLKKLTWANLKATAKTYFDTLYAALVHTHVAADTTDFNTAVRTSTLNQMTAPTADLSINSHKLTNVTDPAAAQDAATKAYVDAVARGLDWKDSVRVATDAAGTLATSFENGDTVDGVVLATGDRILIKDQAAGAANGIYVVAASGAPARATDADASAEVTAGLAVFVSEGTANGDTTWVLTTDDPITLGSTALVFTQLGSGASSSLTVAELDGSPSGTFDTIKVPNGTATDNLDGSVTLDYQPGDATLTALAGLNSTAGLVAETAADTFTKRSIAAGTGLTVSNGSGASGNPTVSPDVSALTTDSSPDVAADFVMTYDTSFGGHKKVLLNLLGPVLALITTRGDILTRGAAALARLALGTQGYVLTSDGTDVIYEPLYASLTFVIDGGGTAITTGIKGDLEIPEDYTVVRATALADQSGSIVVDIWKDVYANYPPTDFDSITASAPVTISGSSTGQDSTLTGWTTTLSAGDTLRYNVDSCSGITRVTIALRVRRR